MGKHNSPMFAQGCADARRDMELMGTCPGNPPLGPTPPYPDYPVMYMRGYERTFVPAPHLPCPGCKHEQEAS